MELPTTTDKIEELLKAYRALNKLLCMTELSIIEANGYSKALSHIGAILFRNDIKMSEVRK